MKSKQKYLVATTVLTITIIFLALVVVYNLLISAQIPFIIKVTLFLSVFLLAIGSIYSFISYILSPMFKANSTLELLLKDTLHELNIPLSVIQANLQMLQVNEQDIKNKKRLKRIDLACDDLQRLYKDLDYYIKREVRFDLEEEFDVAILVNEYVQRLEHVENKINLDLQSLHVHADRHGFIKVVGNLLSNACKHTPKEKNIDIFLKDGKLIFKDEGKGMSQTDLFRIFDRYYQVEKTKEGHGIGLSIVKNYCDEQKVFINIYSQPNLGTTVVLDLTNILIDKKGVADG